MSSFYFCWTLSQDYLIMVVYMKSLTSQLCKLISEINLSIVNIKKKHQNYPTVNYIFFYFLHFLHKKLDFKHLTLIFLKLDDLFKPKYTIIVPSYDDLMLKSLQYNNV